MKQLHNTVARVRSSLDLVNVVSEKKIYSYLNDNKKLLVEVNNLRSEVSFLSFPHCRCHCTALTNPLPVARCATCRWRTSA